MDTHVTSFVNHPEYCCGSFISSDKRSPDHKCFVGMLAFSLDASVRKHTKAFPTLLTNLFYYIYKAPFLESLHLSLEGTYSDTDIVSCFEIASNRSLHELNAVYGFLSSLSLPRRTCETLVVMHLSYVFLNVTLVPLL